MVDVNGGDAKAGGDVVNVYEGMVGGEGVVATVSPPREAEE